MSLLYHWLYLFLFLIFFYENEVSIYENGHFLATGLNYLAFTLLMVLDLLKSFDITNYYILSNIFLITFHLLRSLTVLANKGLIHR